MKNKKQKRARARARRSARSARRAGQQGQKAHLITPIPGTPGPAADGLYDDCPICRAMRDVGIAPTHDGVVMMSEDQRLAYQSRLDEIIAEEGWPDDAIVFGDGREFGRPLTAN